MKIYFAGSIRGGRGLEDEYRKIISSLLKKHTVLTEHVGRRDIFEFSKNFTDKQIFVRDVFWINEADIVIAEVSVPSIGVGWEIAYAQENKKKVICLFNPCVGKSISAMISGNENLVVVKYEKTVEVIKKLEKILS